MSIETDLDWNGDLIYTTDLKTFKYCRLITTKLKQLNSNIVCFSYLVLIEEDGMDVQKIFNDKGVEYGYNTSNRRIFNAVSYDRVKDKIKENIEKVDKTLPDTTKIKDLGKF